MRESKPLQEAKRSMKELAASLRSEREHLAVQIELGRMELKEEWHALEDKWQTFEKTVNEVGDDAKEALHRFGEEIEEAYADLKQRLKDH